MGRKIIGLLSIGLVLAVLLPLGSAALQKTQDTTTETNINQPASQLEVRLWGGLGLHALIKNTGTTDIIGANITLIFDGPGILWGTQENTTKFDIAAGRTRFIIFPLYGFGATNLTFIVDTTTQTASGRVLFYLIFGVK
jgi:hypothetical protein